MSMSDAYQRCEELGIPTDAPDALDRLWDALTADERHEVFPFANDDGSPRTEPWPRTAAPLPVGAGPDGYVLSPPVAGEERMWNGKSELVFTVLPFLPKLTHYGIEIKYTSGAQASTTWRELYEASHVVTPAPAELPEVPRYEAPYAIVSASPEEGAQRRARARELAEAHRVARTAVTAVGLPIRGRLTFPPADGAARARELAAEHIRRARARLDNDVPAGGRPWRPGDTPRGAVLREAADVLARLAAVYLGADSAHESPRNHDEARAYALAFRLVETSARRLSMRRYR